MRRPLVLCAMLLLFTFRALGSDKNAADYPLTAHVLGTAKHRTGGGTTSTYNYQTGQWAHGSYSGSTQRETELRIGNMIYVVTRICKEVEVGKDYPARTDKKRVHLLRPDGKTCDAFVASVHEAQ